MTISMRRWLWALALGFTVTLCAVAEKTYDLAATASAYKAKTLCSAVFVGGRDPASVESEEMERSVHRVLDFFDARVNRERQTVTASLSGFAARHALYRENLGCTLALDVSVETLRAQTVPPPPAPRAPSPWPRNDASASPMPAHTVDTDKLNAVLSAAFAETDDKLLKRTRAILILHRGRIVAERYAPGFNADSPHLGWSLSKSVMNALTGVLVQQGKLVLDQPLAFPEWGGAGDVRARITARHLLSMRSGLKFHEEYANPFSEVVAMLYRAPDSVGFALNRPGEHEPGTHWRYASGDSNLLSRVLLAALDGKRDPYLSFAHRALFEPLGLERTTFEIDTAQNLVGAAYVHASARDWARFGLLYLQDGVWNGKRLLPEGWVSLTTTSANDEKTYGAQFWLKVPAPYNGNGANASTLPPDAFHAVGHFAQFVSIVPSKDLVVVRLGASRPGAWNHVAFLENVLDAFPDASAK